MLQSALGLRPRRALSSAEAKELRLLVQIGSGPFPVSVSFRVYRAGNGKREFELVASGIANDFAGSGYFGQSRADGGRANAAKLLQLLNGGWFLELGQGLVHPLVGVGGVSG